MNTSPERDAEGYLIQTDDWNEDLAHELAREEGIALNDTYWPILNFIRAYHQKHGITPDVRHLISHLATERQCSKKEAKVLVFKLFPYGYVKQACKIAGMIKPRAWSTG